MILTTCAACAAPLAHNAPRCVRCWTRYCDSTCQHDHWRRGHKQMCKKIHRGGNAEQYNADEKYREAVAVAVEACADDTKGQTCYICTQALHWKTKEGLVRMCSCRGTSGFAHVSCLAEQAKVLVAEAEANNLGDKVKCERWTRWVTCGLCKQRYHGVVWCALGWACWKTYVGRPETDMPRVNAMMALGNGLDEAKHHEDALNVQEAELSMRRRLGDSAESILVVQGNLANTYDRLGRDEQSLRLRRDVYSARLKLDGKRVTVACLASALNYSTSLVNLRHFAETKALLRQTVPAARRALGDSHELTIRLRWQYAFAVNDLREAVNILEELAPTARRVLGGAYPLTKEIEDHLRKSRAALRAREETQPSPGSG